MDSTLKGYRDEKSSSYFNQANAWFDQYILQQPLLPQQQQQPKQSKSVLKSRWFRLCVLGYILFSILLTTVHFSSWVIFRKSDDWTYQRTYDPRKLKIKSFRRTRHDNNIIK